MTCNITIIIITIIINSLQITRRRNMAGVTIQGRLTCVLITFRLRHVVNESITDNTMT